MLYTNLNHIELSGQLQKVIENNENVVLCYGKMNYDCVPVFNALELLENEFSFIKMYDVEYDNPEFNDFKQSLQNLNLSQLPYVLLFKKGKVHNAFSGTKNENQLREIFNAVYNNLEQAV